MRFNCKHCGKDLPIERMGRKFCNKYCSDHASKNRKHGMSEADGYWTWREMRRRCVATTRPEYPLYGGRGISVCERWSEFGNFISDMGPRPTKNHTIERIDVNGNYEPSNCKWIPRGEQSLNRRPYSEWRKRKPQESN